MSNNIFVSNLYTNDGGQTSPAYTFITSPNSGIFKPTDGPLCVSVDGTIVAKFYNNNLEIVKDLKISGGSDKAVLTSDSNGMATWKPVNSGSFVWNSIYKNITPDFKAKIDFDQKLKSIPNVFISKESSGNLDNFEVLIKNKTSESFELFVNNSYMFKDIVERDITNYSIVRLSNGFIGICYYDLEEDRIYFMHSFDMYGNKFSNPIIVDDISATGLLDMIVVNGNPAIVYIADNGPTDEFRYIRASDATGKKWEAPVTIVTSTEDINFLPTAIFIKEVNGNPAIFLNDESGRAVMYRAKDENGSAFTNLVNISNLTKHQILSVHIIDGNPAVLARSNNVNNIYYVRASDTSGSKWPIGAQQLYIPEFKSLFVNTGGCCSVIGIIDGKLCALVSELKTNDIYIAKANDKQGNSWGFFEFLIKTNTSSPFLEIFDNNNKTVVLYNDYIGNPSVKNLLSFADIEKNNEFSLTENFMESLDLCQNHKPIKNVLDDNNLILLSHKNKLSLMKFYDNDLKIGWTT